MPLDETAIKTNLGIILQAVLAKAIEQAGFSAIQDYQYDPTCECPDFLIPSQKTPRYMIEVHQTEARNSFQMKTLRAFTAVTESKAFYGDSLVTVNVLFGDPENELPASNVRALCGAFDVNVVPRRDVTDIVAVINMEKAALTYASDDSFKNKTAKAAEEVIGLHGNAVTTLAEMMKKVLGAAKARKELFPMWQAERLRTGKLGKPPLAGQPSYFKRGLLGSLFLTDGDFKELLSKKDPNLCSHGVQHQLVMTKMAKVEEMIDGDNYTLDPQFLTFLNNPKAAEFRVLCKSELDALPDLHWFFEDIRDPQRRNDMATSFVETVKKGRSAIAGSIVTALKGNMVDGIEHSRCWPADLMALLVKHSQNDFNRRMVQSGRDPENYQYPFNHITGRFERLLGCPHHFITYATFASEIFEEVCREDGIDDEYIASAVGWLPDAILKLRLDGAIKLQKFNPLYACLGEICSDYGLEVRPEKIKSITFDLAGGRGRLGKYDALVIENDGCAVMTLTVAVHDQNGDHKSKEWGARRLATLYRLENGNVHQSEFTEGLFVLDGEWEDKHIARLYRSGWNHICRLGDLEDTLKKIFKLKRKAIGAKAKKRVLVLEGGEDA